jgi:hypothetical protein
MLSFSKLTRCSRNSPGYLTLAQVLKNSLRLFYGTRRLKLYIQEPSAAPYLERDETKPNLHNTICTFSNQQIITRLKSKWFVTQLNKIKLPTLVKYAFFFLSFFFPPFNATLLCHNALFRTAGTSQNWTYTITTGALANTLWKHYVRSL